MSRHDRERDIYGYVVAFHHEHRVFLPEDEARYLNFNGRPIVLIGWSDMETGERIEPRWYAVSSLLTGTGIPEGWARCDIREIRLPPLHPPAPSAK